ncbi:MAG: hypothetical protein U1F53_01525 [Burkholderiaceae bacterium]
MTHRRTLVRAAACAATAPLSLLAGCATALAPMSAALRQQRPAGLPARVSLAEARRSSPTTARCAARRPLASVLAAAGAPATPAELTGEVYLPARGGSLAVG